MPLWRGTISSVHGLGDSAEAHFAAVKGKPSRHGRRTQASRLPIVLMKSVGEKMIATHDAERANFGELQSHAVTKRQRMVVIREKILS